MKTLELATLTNGHPPTGVSPENFQKMTYSLSTGAQSIQSPSFTLPSNANRVALMARIRFTPADAGAAFQAYIGTTPIFNGAGQVLHNGALDGVLYFEYTSGNPVGTSSFLKFEITPVVNTVATTGTLEIGQVDVINLTSIAGVSPS